jgi:predicted phage tail component-like protein
MFTFNGVTASTMGINVNRPEIQAMSALNNQIQNVDAGDGVIDFGTYFTEKIITFECNFKPKATLALMQTTIDTLNSYLNPKLGLKSLILDEMPTRVYQARLYTGIDMSKVVRTGANFTISFICPSPYALSTSQTNLQYTTAGIKNFSVTGNATAKPVIEIVASIPIDGNNISFDFNGIDLLEIRGVIENTFKLVIDCNEYTVKYIEIATPTNESNGLPFIDKIAFPELLNGSNQLDISIGSGSTLTSIDIDFYPRYI